MSETNNEADAILRELLPLLEEGNRPIQGETRYSEWKAAITAAESRARTYCEATPPAPTETP